ncbi:MAG: A/G-specific adenine glycosylase [Acidobacteriaceae bacterium]|nr:A/G-specific adenine glycosylase [Acidobacteriaceae bacterium]
MLSSTEINGFRAELLTWFAGQRRDLPWRRTRDPYAIWISEVMLQQTRVTAVVPYYERFLARFPDLKALADASESELLAAWAGLGYYYRARNLQEAAKRICAAGAFPREYEKIRQLPGIGAYTAAAVASIAFDQPHAVLDGNVFRVLSRILGDATNIASTAGRKHFAAVAERLLDRARPGTFNQAVMELGALVCLPKNPQCLVCPVAGICKARASGRQNELPVKIVARKSVEEFRVLYWIERGNGILAWQRRESSRLMPGFWELPERDQLPQIMTRRMLGSFRHSITFHRFRFDVWEADAPARLGECQWISLEELNQLPQSTIFKKARRVVDGAGEAATARSAAASGL